MEKLISPQELAKATGLKLSYVYHLTHNRRIPFLKLGNTVKFRMDAIEEWLTGCGVTPVAPVARVARTDKGKRRVNKDKRRVNKDKHLNAIVEAAKKQVLG